MKKSLLALAMLGAAFSSAQAADVTVYGVIDYGFIWQNQDVDINTHSDNDPNASYSYGSDQTTFGLGSGIDSSTRIGIKGSEDLGNGMTVSFKLENGFDGDRGTMGQNGRLFGREASLTLAGNFGALSFGRMGGLTSSCGTYDVFMAAADAFDGGDNAVETGFYMSDRYDNMVTYASPEFSGFKVYAQYSFEQNGSEDSHEGNNDRFAALGASYNVGNLALVAAIESFQYANDTHGKMDDGLTVNLGGSYDFGVAKVFAAAQYAKNVDGFGTLDIDDLDRPALDDDGIDSWSLMLGTQIPVAAGTFTFAGYYADGETTLANNTVDVDGKYYGLAARYEYPLSQRTTLYTGAGWAHNEYDANYTTAKYVDDGEIDDTQVYAGIVHKF